MKDISVTLPASAFERSIDSALNSENRFLQSEGRTVPSAVTTFLTAEFLAYALTSSLTTFPLRVSVPVAESKETLEASSA